MRLLLRACLVAAACTGVGCGGDDPAGPVDGGRMDGPIDAVAPDGAGAETGGGGAETGGGGAETGGAPTNLEGGWYARDVAVDGGVGRYRRLRFRGDAYFFADDAEHQYCVEVGTFTLVGVELHLRPDHVRGFGPCREQPPRTLRLTWMDAGFRLEGEAAPFSRIRGVPKVFVTVETHDGNLAGDPLLPGANAIAKADSLCDRSAAKPDNGRYRAVLADDINRAAMPPRDWVLKPQTTYFDPSGTFNVFTTDRSGMTFDKHGAPLRSFERNRYVFTGVAGATCKGWTSSSEEESANAADFYSGNSAALNGTRLLCAFLDKPFLCVGEGATPGELGAALPNPGSPAADVTGSWYAGDFTSAEPRTARTLRLDGMRYQLVFGDSGYCAEVGRFDVGATGIRFLPDRVDGSGACRIGDARVEALRATPDELALTYAGRTTTYRRAPMTPKLFVTIESHDGNFAGDPTLTGATAIAKADAFCNLSLGRPDGQTYKAMLVDGVDRSVVPRIDWVLRPGASYHYTDGTTRVLQTDAQGLRIREGQYPSLIGPLITSWGTMWYGLEPDGTAKETCMRWSSGSSSVLGRPANWRGEASYSTPCSVWERLICVSQ